MANIAIFTLTKDRLHYTKRTLLGLKKTAKGEFDHFIVDNGSRDGTAQFLTNNPAFKHVILNRKNLGISKASNQALDVITYMGGYEYIIKVDNDCDFIDPNWLDGLLDVELEKPGIYSPYVGGLRENKGGAPRIGLENIANHPVGITRVLGGICTIAPAYLFKTFRFTEKGKPYIWGAMAELCEKSGLPCGYVEDVSVEHMDTTDGQEAKYPKYFIKRKEERTTIYAGEDDDNNPHS